MNGMELRHIRYFLAVAEEGNFTRAAARVGIGQPPLSLQIRDLETEVGVQLFRRVPRGAELTEAGKAFFATVRSIPDQFADAARKAQQASRGEIGALRLGFTNSAAMNPVVPGSIRAFRSRYPSVHLTLTEGHSTELAKCVRGGSLDIAFLRPGTIDPDGLRLDPLPDEPMVAAVALGHPALPEDADAPIRLADLKEEAFILTPREPGPTLYDEAIKACGEAGFQPRVVQASPQISSALALVAAADGVSIVPESMRQLALVGVAYRPIADADPIARLSIAYSERSHLPLATNFLAEVRTQVSERQPD